MSGGLRLIIDGQPAIADRVQVVRSVEDGAWWVEWTAPGASGGFALDVTDGVQIEPKEASDA
jgi:hypothetical protein